MLEEAFWAGALPARLEYGTFDSKAFPDRATVVRACYTRTHLLLRYDAPYTTLSTFEPPILDRERAGLWDRDVVEAFIGTDPKNPKIYYEFEVAPTNEKLDLVISPEIPDVGKRLEWSSAFESAVKLDETRKVWTTLMRIPLHSLSKTLVRPGTRWRINFYRIDRASGAFLAWNPTLTRSYHEPERFGWLEFRD